MKNIRIQFMQGSMLFLAVAVLVIGLLNQEYEAVFRKAINICLECIGIG